MTVLISGVVFAVVLTAPALGQHTGNPVENTDGGVSYVPGEIAIRLEDGTYETRPVATDDIEKIKDKAAEIEAEPTVEVAGPNFVYELDQAIEEPGAPVGVDEPTGGVGSGPGAEPPFDFFWQSDQQPNLRALRLPGAWNQTRGAGIRVAVVDGGWVKAHPELRDDVVAEYDFVDEDADASADTLNPHHATQVGSIAAGETNNDRGIAAAGWAATVMVARACASACASVDTSAAVDWARENGAKVINLSFGAHQEPPGDPVLNAAVQRALNANIVVIASAGNTGSYDASRYPSDYPGVLGVGSTVVGDPSKISQFSRRGPGVDVVAPSEVATGKGIIMACNPNFAPDKSFCRQYGTSYSAAQVSGVAALVRAYSPSLTQAQVVTRILNEAEDLGPAGRDDAYGYGEVDAKCSVRPDIVGC